MRVYRKAATIYYYAIFFRAQMLIEFAKGNLFSHNAYRVRAPGELRGTPGSHLKPISAQINNQIMKIEEERDGENPSQLTRARAEEETLFLVSLGGEEGAYSGGGNAPLFYVLILTEKSRITYPTF